MFVKNGRFYPFDDLGDNLAEIGYRPLFKVPAVDTTSQIVADSPQLAVEFLPFLFFSVISHGGFLTFLNCSNHLDWD